MWDMAAKMTTERGSDNKLMLNTKPASAEEEERTHYNTPDKIFRRIKAGEGGKVTDITFAFT